MTKKIIEVSIIERWKPFYWDNEKSNYLISNKGRVQNKKTGRILKPTLTNEGYYCVRLIKNKKAKTFKIHRLVAMTFLEKPKDKNKCTVNHKNGYKKNNYSSNLEWMSFRENVNHSVENNLHIHHKNKCNLNNLDEKIIHRICSMMQDGMDKKIIKDKIYKYLKKKDLIDSNTNKKDIKELIHNLYNNNIYKDIVSQYDFGNKDNLYGIAYSVSQIEEVCKLLEENKLTYSEISEITNVSKEMISYIRTKKCWRKVSKKYNFDNYSKSIKSLNINTVNKICKLLEENKYDIKDIAKKTDVSTQTIKKIINKKIYTDISDKYNILTLNNKFRTNDKNKIIEVCKLLEENRYTNKKIAEITGIPKYTVADIKSGKRWKQVSEKFNIPSIKEMKKEKEHKAILICELLESSNLSNKEISKKLNCSIDLVGDIKRRRIYKKLSKKYIW